MVVAPADSEQVGDQIVRVNGLPVAEALHHELLQLVGQQTRLSLAVRTVGMLPVKDEDHNVLTWQVVSAPSPDPALNGTTNQDVQLILTVPPGAKLGCGICRGPEWRPGVFIQFTKEGGLARSTGLRAGDQLLQCNGVPFTDDLPFSEAVALLKSARQLVLLVRPGAGADLFPSESSGYNSSASSIAGDVSPNPAEKQRLIPLVEPRRPEETRAVPVSNPCTVIHVGPENHIQDNRNNHLAQVRLVQQQQETTTVLVEVHRADDKPVNPVPCPPPPLNPLAPIPPLSKSESSSSISSFSSALSQEIERRRNQRRDGNSIPEIIPRRVKLSGVDEEKRHQHEQLMQEFKRAHRKMFANSPDTVDDGCSHGKTISTQERNSSSPQVNGKNSVKDRIQSIDSLRRQNSSPLPVLSDNSDSLTWSSKRSSFDQSSSLSSGSSGGAYGQPPPCPTPDYDTSSVASSLSVTSSADSSKYVKESQPRELLKTNGVSNKSPVNGTSVPNANSGAMKNVSSGNGTVIIQKSIAPNSVTVKTNSVNSKPTNSVSLVNGSTKPVNSNGLNQNKAPAKPSNDGVEMESLESFELTNPQNPEPKPPETYFPKRRQQSSIASSPKSTLSTASTSTAGRKPRPVSVTIGEYPSGTTRREPSKFTFLSGTDQTDIANGGVTDRLQSELMRTLNRSDLKRRTEQQESAINGTAVNNSTTNGANPSAAAKGTVTISVNTAPLKNTPVRLFDGNGGKVSPSATPAIRNVAEKLNGTLGGTASGNRVTIRVGSEPAVLMVMSDCSCVSSSSLIQPVVFLSPCLHEKKTHDSLKQHICRRLKSMMSNRIQKLLFSEYSDFEDMVLVESPFAEITKEGNGIRQVHLGWCVEYSLYIALHLLFHFS
ncbi:uncharacterized protein GBIM_10355 [Gryllus bimaculatus]|nr:uncharacterized protein GBIM_10355 [Gryllus bimaculatus]